MGKLILLFIVILAVSIALCIIAGVNWWTPLAVIAILMVALAGATFITALLLMDDYR